MIVDVRGQQITTENINNSDLLSLFIIQSDSYICKSPRGFIDEDASEAVQYSRGIRKKMNL